MSMLGISFLNEIINKNEILHPGKILNHLRENVITSLHQTGKEGEAKDGMDIALCVFDIEEGNKAWPSSDDSPGCELGSSDEFAGNKGNKENRGNKGIGEVGSQQNDQ